MPFGIATSGKKRRPTLEKSPNGAGGTGGGGGGGGPGGVGVGRSGFPLMRRSPAHNGAGTAGIGGAGYGVGGMRSEPAGHPHPARQCVVSINTKALPL